MPRMNRSIAELKQELRVKQRMLRRLLAGRKKVLASLARIDRRIAAIGGQVADGRTRKAGRRGRKGKRRRATGRPLVEFIKAVLGRAGKPVRAKDVATAVVKAGYPTHSRSFYGIVAAALRTPKLFKRTGRGLYTLAK